MYFLLDKIKQDEITPQLLRRSLKYTFSPFFGKFGKFTDVQIKSIPLILKGENVIISSSTGSGKTLAAVAPSVECLIREKNENDKIIYVSPTRALVNDAYKRINSPFSHLNLLAIKRTGDYKVSAKKLLKAKIVLTTPESIDSMLTNSFSTLKSLFESTRFVILDEIHLLDNSPRGDQLRILVERIRDIRNTTSKKLQFIAMSATISNLRNVGSRYFDNPNIIKNTNTKNISFNSRKFSNKEVSELRTLIVKHKFRKILVFCNSRRETEKLATQISKNIKINIEILVHHGSLSKGEREKVERRMNESKYAICVSTMTLELGIDIGDIDVVILKKPPKSLNSFLQRIGRGCRRRKDKTIAIGWHETEEEKVLFKCFEYYAKKQSSDENFYFPRYSVTIQQVFSILKQYLKNNGLEEQKLLNFMMIITQDREIAKNILNHLIEKKYITFYRNNYFPERKLLDEIEKHTIYSNISRGKVFEDTVIVNSANNERIGFVGSEQLYIGKKILIGGRNWNVTSFKSNKVFVRADKQFGNTHFKSKAFKENYTFKFCQILKEFLYKDERIIIYYTTEKFNEIILHHYLGTIYSVILASIMEIMDYKVYKKSLNATSFVIKGITEEKILDLDITKIISNLQNGKLKLIEENASSIKRALEYGPYFELLPDMIQLQNLVNSISLEPLIEHLLNVKLENLPII